jgi:hypothetical protein
MNFVAFRAPARLAALGAILCCTAGCAGNGEGLDESGRPVGEAGTPLTASLQSIQDNVFTPICTQCHEGAAAPLGLRLDAASAYAMLVNAPSSEVPSLQRVTPGDPDNSYIIQKLEGRAAVGGQMPLGQPPLPQETIAAIRQWIADGALAAMAAPNVMPMQVRAVVPAPGDVMAGSGTLLLEASGELDAASLTPANVVLLRSGGDGTFGDANDVAVQPLHIAVRSLTPTVLAIGVDGKWVPDSYRLVIRGNSAAAARDREGVPLGNFTLEFSVSATMGEAP